MAGAIPPALPSRETPVAVLRNTYDLAVCAPGAARPDPRHCTGPDCPHTSDWRQPEGSPANAHGVQACGAGIGLREALETVWPFDAMVLGYVVLGPDGQPLELQPRVTKLGLAWIESQGFRVMMTCFLADLDNPEHAAWTPELRTDYERKRASIPELQTAGDYITPHGARIVQPIWPWLPVRVGEIAQRQWLERLRAGGLPDSSDTSDWTRCMRLPRALRDGGQLDCELRTEGMVPITVSKALAPSPGPVGLAARITDATTPKAPPRAVTGPELARFADNLCRRTTPGFRASGAALKLVLQGLPWAARGHRHHVLLGLARDLVREFYPCDVEPLAAYFDLSVNACRVECGDAWNPSPARLPIAHLRAAVAHIESEREAREILKGQGFARGDAPELAARLAEDLRGDSPVPVLYDRGAVHRYDPARGVWDALDDAAIERVVQGYAGRMLGGESEKPHPLALSQGAIEGAVKALKALVARRDFLNAAPAGLAFANGFLVLRGGLLVLDAHDPEHRALHPIPEAYDPGAACPQTRARLAEIVVRDTPEETRAVVEFVLAFWGVALFGVAPRYETGVILQGPKGSGKSQVLKLAAGLFPAELRCALTPHEIAETFLKVKLAGKRINLRAEISYTEISETHVLNSVVTGDAITVQEKHKPGYELLPTCALMFAGNELHGTREMSGAWQERMAVVVCPGRFRNTPGQVRDLAAELLAAERPGIYAACLQAFERAARAGGLVRPASVLDANKVWVETTDPVRQFVRECCAPTETAGTRIEALYGAYRRWTTDAGHLPLARGTLGSRLRGLGYHQHTRTGSLYTLALKASPGGPGTVARPS